MHILLAILAMTGLADAQDILILQNGTEMEGRILSEQDGCLEVQVPSGKVTLQKGQIARIDSTRPFERYASYGRKLLSKKDYVQAAAVYREGTQKFGDDPEEQTSLAAGLLEAGRGLLSQRRYEDGRQALSALLEALPSHSEATQLFADTDRMCRKIRKEIAGFQRVVEESPGNDFARFHLGLRYESLGEEDKAREQYLTIIKRYPQVKVGDFDGHIDTLRGFIQKHMVVSDEPNQALETGEGFQEAQPGEFLKLSAHRVLIFNHNVKLAERIAEEVKQRLPKIEEELRVASDDRPYVIYVYRDEKEYGEATGQAGTTGFCAEARVIHLYQTAPRLLQSVLPHELAHATLYRRFKRLPSWLDEGLAVRYEWSGDVRYAQIKRWFEEGRTVAIQDLFRRKVTRLSGEEREIFYAQSYTLVDYLLHEVGGWDAFLRFLEAVGAGKDVAWALKHVYGLESPEELDRLWKRYMEL